jgi:hypothetical protein
MEKEGRNSGQLHFDYLPNPKLVSGECIQNLKETISANERRLENPAQFPVKFVSIGKKAGRYLRVLVETAIRDE